MTKQDSFESVKRVIEAFERSDWSEIDVRFGDVRLHLSTGSDETIASPAAAPAPTRDIGGTEERSTGDRAGETAGPVADAVGTPPADAPHVVTAPSPGVFWRSPEPGAPPFADVGDEIEPSTTVCILEVMKLMSHIKAGVGGVVVSVYGENGTAVQKGDPLFGIAPADEAPPG